MKKRALTLTTTFMLLTVLAGFAEDEKKSAADTITIEELRDHMFFLASDDLGGRVVGTPEYKIAADYGASQFRQAGLKPIFKTENGKSTYLQKVPLLKSYVSSIHPFTVISGDEEFKLPIDDKLIKPAFISNFKDMEVPVVFVGYGINEPDHGWNDLKGIDLEGKAVIMLAGAPIKDGKPVLPAEVNQKYISLQGSQQKAMALIRQQPAIVIVVLSKREEVFWNMIPSSEARERYTLASEDSDEQGGRSRPNFFVAKTDSVARIFENQKFNPADMEEKGMENYGSFDLEGVAIMHSFETKDTEVITWNVVGIVEGTDPSLKEEYVTLGAHLDHVGPVSGHVRNGADDNASGSIGVMEVAEAVAMTPPARSTIFLLYAAEEVGLYGSRHFLNVCPVPAENIVFNINLDMIGRTDKASSKNRSHYVLGSYNECEGLEELVNRVNERSVNWPINLNKERMYGGSDHMSYRARGIPVLFFFSGDHRDLHRPTDDPEKIEYDKMQNLCKLVYELVIELGTGPRLTLNE